MADVEAVETTPAATPSTTDGDGTLRGDGRDVTGKFTKGNKCAVGNPFGRKVARLRAALVEGVTEENLRQLAAKLVGMALAGDLDAAQLLLAYTIGKPVPARDPDLADREELDLRLSAPTQVELLEGALRVSHADALRLAHALAGIGLGSFVRHVLGRPPRQPADRPAEPGAAGAGVDSSLGGLAGQVGDEGEPA